MVPKQAIQTAMAYVREAYFNHQLAHVLLEEIRYDEESKRWYVTIGFDSLSPSHPVISALPAWATQPRDRTFKVVEVDSLTGKPVSLKIREFALS